MAMAPPLTPGKGMMRVSGILLIVWAVIWLPIIIFTMDLTMSQYWLTMIPMLLELLCGFCGIGLARQVDAAGLCKVFGVLALIGIFVAIFVGRGWTWWMLLDFLFVILFLCGSYTNKTAVGVMVL